MTRILRAGWLAALLLSGPALAAGQAADGALTDPAAFEQGFTASLYQFDGCGDALAGRMFRRALADRFAHCPFTPEARARFARRTHAEQAKVRRIMQHLIDTNGGLPRQLDGMPMTCHALQARDDYRSFRQLLEQYEQGAVPAEAVIPAPCDSASITP